MSIAVSCRKCGSRRSVPDNEICLGVRCRKCEMFMEAERDSNLEDLDWLGRKRVRQLTPLAKTWLLLLIVGSLTAAPLLYLSGHLEAAGDSMRALRGVLITLAISLLNVVFALVVLSLRKWGFYTLVGVAAVGGLLALIVGMWHVTLVEWAAIGLLFAVLKAGAPDSWLQLR